MIKKFIFGFFCLLMLPLSSDIYAENAKITFQVNIPTNTPVSDMIYIAGNHESAGNWDPGKIDYFKSAQ